MLVTACWDWFISDECVIPYVAVFGVGSIMPNKLQICCDCFSCCCCTALCRPQATDNL
uniref:Uncharacterized protein n=1 Tax=Arundo donax TaxID=35708 RepID=A0A0A9FY96_ARUDO